jgi:hypothetical protein
VSREEWIAARKELLNKEKELSTYFANMRSIFDFYPEYSKMEDCLPNNCSFSFSVESALMIEQPPPPTKA